MPSRIARGMDPEEIGIQAPGGGAIMGNIGVSVAPQQQQQQPPPAQTQTQNPPAGAGGGGGGGGGGGTGGKPNPPANPPATPPGPDLGPLNDAIRSGLDAINAQRSSLADLFNRPILPPDFARRQQLLNFRPAPADRSRTERAYAAIFQGLPQVQELAATATDFPVQDYRTAVQRYFATTNDPDVVKANRDPVAFAEQQGLIPKPPPRKATDIMDEVILGHLRDAGLMAPELEARVTAQLQARADAEARGEDMANLTPAQVGGSRFLPPIPSAQFFNQANVAERQGLGQLFGALGVSPELLQDQVRRLAPPGGGSNLASLMFRAR